MSTKSSRVTLGALAVSALYVGAWAEFGPRSFYVSFPGFGRHWVSALGAYDEHLVRDVGGLYLALAVMSVGALWLGERRTTLVAGLAWLAFGVPHLVFHLWHLDPLAEVDQVFSIAGLGVTVLAAAALVAGSVGRRVSRPAASAAERRGASCA